MLSSSENMLDAVPLLMLTDCLETCRNNATCLSVNYETGLCVLFSASADKLQGKWRWSDWWLSYREKLWRIFRGFDIYGNELLTTFFIDRINDEISVPGVYNLRSEDLSETTTLWPRVEHRQGSRLYVEEKPHQTLINRNVTSRLLRDVLRRNWFPMQVIKNQFFTIKNILRAK